MYSNNSIEAAIPQAEKILAAPDFSLASFGAV
jgi:hypothetical protein